MRESVTTAVIANKFAGCPYYTPQQQDLYRELVYADGMNGLLPTSMRKFYPGIHNVAFSPLEKAKLSETLSRKPNVSISPAYETSSSGL